MTEIEISRCEDVELLEKRMTELQPQRFDNEGKAVVGIFVEIGTIRERLGRLEAERKTAEVTAESEKHRKKLEEKEKLLAPFFRDFMSKF